jgi:hypothetical protein
MMRDAETEVGIGNATADVDNKALRGRDGKSGVQLTKSCTNLPFNN